MGRPPRKKKDIERSALELFCEKGVDGTSIRDIAERAGVTEGALYRHHKSKDDLVRALFFESFASFAEMISEVDVLDLPFDEKMRRLVEAFFLFHDKDPYVFRFVMLIRHKLLDEARADEHNPVEVLERLMKRAVKKKIIPAQDAALTTQLLMGMVLQCAVACYFGRVKKPLKKHAKRVSDACLAVCGFAG